MDSTLLFGLGQAGVKARLWSNAFAPSPSPHPDHAWDERMSTPDGSIGFQRVPAGRSVVYFTKEGYKPQEYDTIMPDDGAHEIRLTPEPLPLLTSIENHRFVDMHGKRVFAKGCSDFLVYWRHLRGEDVTPILRERRDLGFNVSRVFGMCHYIPVNEFGLPAFNPKDYGETFYTELPYFNALLNQHGQYLYWSCFPDNGIIMPNQQEKEAHHERVVSLSRDLYELTNEIDAHDFNWVDATKFTRPEHVLACSGSAGEGRHANRWDFYDFHPRRDYPAHIKDCCQADNPNFLDGYEGMVGEPDRYGWAGNTNARQAFESAGTAKGTALGIVFHSKRGVRSELFDDATMACARAFLEAIGDD